VLYNKDAKNFKPRSDVPSALPTAFIRSLFTTACTKPPPSNPISHLVHKIEVPIFMICAFASSLRNDNPVYCAFSSKETSTNFFTIL
jgi:hypothetical protein